MEETKSSQNQNIDNELDFVSDEYLRKKKRNNKIIFSCISAFVLALAVVIITLACVRIDLKPYFLSEPTNISINTAEGTYSVTPADENYNRYDDIYQSSFNSSVLTALFTGNLGAYQIVEERQEHFYGDPDNKTGIDEDLAEYLTDNYVHLYYSQPQSLRNADGSQYNTIYSSRVGAMYYKDVYFNISDTDTEQELTFYFGGYRTNVGSADEEARIVKITVRANTYKLYQLAIGDLN